MCILGDDCLYNKCVYHAQQVNTTCYIHFQRDQLEKYLPRHLIYSLLWSFSGDSKMKYREELGKMIQKITTIPLPNTSVMPLIDYEVYVLFDVYYRCSLHARLYHCPWWFVILLFRSRS